MCRAAEHPQLVGVLKAALINTHRSHVKARLLGSRTTVGWRLWKLPYVFCLPRPPAGSGGSGVAPRSPRCRGGRYRRRRLLPLCPGPGAPNWEALGAAGGGGCSGKRGEAARGGGLAAGAKLLRAHGKHPQVSPPNRAAVPGGSGS